MIVRSMRFAGVAFVAAALFSFAGCDSRPVDPGIEVADPIQSALAKPIAGGTMWISPDGGTAVAADPEFDRLHVVDVNTLTVAGTVQLETGAEPGRIVSLNDNEVLVVLRRAGRVAKLNRESLEVAYWDVCPAPRGIAVDPTDARVYVSCVGGDFQTLDSAGNVENSKDLGRDLRDIVIDGDSIYVTRFRSAEVLQLSRLTGEMVTAVRPPYVQSSGLGRNFKPAVAWRMRSFPGGGVTVMHQRALVTPVPAENPETDGGSSYGGTSTCDANVVHSAATTFGHVGHNHQLRVGGFGGAVLPVDFDVSPSGLVAVASAGTDSVVVTLADQLLSQDFMDICSRPETILPLGAEPVALSFIGNTNDLLVQLRSPSVLVRIPLSNPLLMTQLSLGTEPRANVGHRLFHHQTSPEVELACASCHPEGHEDGHIWDFEALGPRRTQTLSGGVMATAPLHWDGSLNDMHQLMSEVFVGRMGGSPVHPTRTDALGEWLNGVKAVPRARHASASSVASGEALFNDATIGCATCHSGEHFTNNLTMGVGTGAEFQVPTLVGIAARAPFMHNGCAKTLTERFTIPFCGGGDEHGKTSQLSAAEVADLVAYLETL